MFIRQLNPVDFEAQGISTTRESAEIALSGHLGKIPRHIRQILVFAVVEKKLANGEPYYHWEVVFPH